MGHTGRPVHSTPRSPSSLRRTKSVTRVSTPSYPTNQLTKSVSHLVSKRKLDKVPTSLHWTHGAQNSVKIVGSFTSWKDPIDMIKESEFVYSVVIPLSVGIHSYKFIVDGDWRYCGNQETIVDPNGNVNNCLFVTRNITIEDVPLSLQLLSPAHQRRKSDSLTNNKVSMINNQLLLPGVQEITRFGEPLSNMKLMNSVKKTDSSDSLTTYATEGNNRHKLLLVMVGLPARGKSYISRKLSRYLNWLGYKCSVFNLGNYRRTNLGSHHQHDFFRPDNEEGKQARTQVALQALEDLANYYHSGGSIGILDGTNSTEERRMLILNEIKKLKPSLIIKTIFIEVLCSDSNVINANILASKLSSPDYVGIEPSQIIQDFTERIQHYQSAYETLSRQTDHRYIKIFDIGRQIVANRITGFMPGKVMFYLSNLHIIPRPIYLVRHGESEYNVENRVGGDSGLTDKGREFAKRLQQFMKDEIPNAERELCVWSSTMKRAVETAEQINCVQYIRWKAMEEINVGVCDGMTYEEIEEQMPEEFQARAKDKLRYRYPRGESYEDLIQRVEPIITELERQRKPILIIGHRAVLRCLYAYFADNCARDQVPFVSFPLNEVVRLSSRAHGTEVKRFPLDL